MILLSFDIEEFDVPLENGVQLPFERQISISSDGTYRILSCLRQHRVQATFFCTANFAVHAPEVIRDILRDGHEIASHGYYHSSFDVNDLKQSRELLERQTGLPVRGFRMARMMPVDEKEIRDAGYLYNSSLNPTCIPGRYNHLKEPRTWFYREGVLQIPASVTPSVRFPLFWLSCHVLPPFLYRRLMLSTLKHDGYVMTYFHPWEFVCLSDHRREWKLPYIMTRHSGDRMVRHLDDLISFFQTRGSRFGTCSEFVGNITGQNF